MELVRLVRMTRDRSSENVRLIFRGEDSHEETPIAVATSKAALVAQESNGFSDRCRIYHLFMESARRLGACFCGVALATSGNSRDEEASAFVVLMAGDELTWVPGALCEIIAFAVHVRLPIRLVSKPEQGQTEIPEPFERALEEIFGGNQAGDLAQ